MSERISPPKLKGYEDQNVFDLAAYRDALRATTLRETFRDDIITLFDSIADEMRDLEHAEDGLEFALQVHGIASRLEREARARGEHIAAEPMKALSDALTFARAAAAAARHNEESEGSLQDTAARIERAKKELLRAIELLFVQLVHTGPQT